MSNWYFRFSIFETKFSLHSINFLSLIVQSLSRVWLCMTPWTAARRLLCSSLYHGVCWNSCALNQWCHPIISSSVIPFSSYLQSFPESGSFLMSWLFASGGQSIGASALASVLPMKYSELISFRIDWFDLLKSKGLSRVFSSSTVRMHQFFGAQPSLWSSSHIHTWLLEKP